MRCSAAPRILSFLLHVLEYPLWISQMVDHVQFPLFEERKTFPSVRRRSACAQAVGPPGFTLSVREGVMEAVQRLSQTGIACPDDRLSAVDHLQLAENI